MTSRTLRIGIDEKTGYLTELTALMDDSRMNWVQDGSDWGAVDGFSMSVRKADGQGAIVEGVHSSLPLQLQVIRQVVNGCYEERYAFLNSGKYDFFCTPDMIGIHFPFRCKMDRKDIPMQMETKCTAHVWCGGDTCWIYGHKISGHAPHMMIHMTQGCIREYSIYRDVSRSKSASDYRGDIVLNPDAFVIPAGQFYELVFLYESTDMAPQIYYRTQTDMLTVESDRYTLFPGEIASLAFFCRKGLADCRATVNGRPLQLAVDGDSAAASWRAEKTGEYLVEVSANGKKTFARLQVLPTVDKILEKRAYFIAEKQQYHRENSALDGAYLIFDDDTDSLYFEPNGDRNASRERIAMGVVVAQQLQRRFDRKLYDSLLKYTEFLEREIFDTETLTVYNEIGKDSTVTRAYNEPWISVFYRELFLISREQRHLCYSADVLIRYYEHYGTENWGCCVEPYETAELLEQNGELARAKRLRSLAKQYTDYRMKMKDHFAKYFETGFNHEFSNADGSAFFEGAVHHAEPAYLAEGERWVVSSRSYYSFQPDYRMWGISVRHWDCYWFGKRRLFGDLFPHYWSAKAAAMLAAYREATGADCGAEIRQILLGNLCLYREDGFASNSYLSPFRIQFFVPDSAKPYHKYPESFGIHYGKTYDSYANDQDWALYYAVKLEKYLQPKLL